MTTARNRADVARVATILRAKAAALLSEMRGGPPVAEFLPSELLEMANVLDPDRAVTLGTIKDAAKKGSPC
jgi:hypothetical protein